ncbi:MAG: hypothetical protein M1113_04710 [Candidatus Thermoplasmatota archaeon]|nr:hypothetical protein [Candidatus Thermoplasmatota archaeon]
MNDLVSNGIPKSRSAHLAGVSRSMIYYQHRKSGNSNTMLIWRNLFRTSYRKDHHIAQEE